MAGWDLPAGQAPTLCTPSSPGQRVGAQEPLPSPFPTHHVTWPLPPRLAVLGFLRPPKDSPHPHGCLWDHLQLTLASSIPPSSCLSRSIRQLKERVANLRVKHDQIYNFSQQQIEPQVNWSTVIEEKQVPRGP